MEAWPALQKAAKAALAPGGCPKELQAVVRSISAKICEVEGKNVEEELSAQKEEDVRLGLGEARKERIRQKGMSWLPRLPRVQLRAVSRPDGSIAVDGEEAAGILQEHWGAVFAKHTTDPRWWEALRPFVPKLPAMVQWQFTDEDLLQPVSPYVRRFWVTVQRFVEPTHRSLEAFPVLRPPPFGQPDEGWRPFKIGLRVRTFAVGLQEL